MVKINDKFYNRAISFSGKTYQYYDKNKIIPFFEYAPFNYSPFYVLHENGSEDILLSKGNNNGIFNININNNEYKYGIFICLEDFFCDLSRNYKKQGASFLVNLTNDALLQKKEASFIHCVVWHCYLCRIN